MLLARWYRSCARHSSGELSGLCPATHLYLSLAIPNEGGPVASHYRAPTVGGGEEEDRTPDLCIANAALSQLSYPPTDFYSSHD